MLWLRYKRKEKHLSAIAKPISVKFCSKTVSISTTATPKSPTATDSALAAPAPSASRAKFPSPSGAKKRDFRFLRPHSPASNRRLSCQTKVLGDIKVTKYDGFWGQGSETVWKPEA